MKIINFLLSLVFKRLTPHHSKQIDKEVLQQFVNNFHWGENLNDMEAKSNLEAGLLEIIAVGKGHYGNGLLITENGYFVTNYHCVDLKDLSLLNVVLANGASYPITKVCGYNKKSDVALVKADIPGAVSAKLYKFSNSHIVKKNSSLVLLTRWDGLVKVKGGSVAYSSFISANTVDGQVCHNQIVLSTDCAPGDSGGVVVSQGFRVYGLMCSKLQGSEKIGTCTFWFQVLSVISAVINAKKK